ncbi:MAG: RecX family transcriptional regulator [Caldilineaceae bacterium]|nr:RecX family transcriptional regulator [Caldilineaceae bacterium]
MTTQVITRLQVQQKNKERVNIFLNDDYAFSLDLMLAAGLKKGQVLATAEIAALQAEDEGKRAYAAALTFLGQRARSQTEVEQRLQQRDFSPTAIDQTVARLQQEGYLNDTTFGEQWVANRQRFRPRSERALRYELRRKGMDATVVDAVLEEAAIDEDAAAWAALEPKLARWQGLDHTALMQKAGGFLARRGFGHAVARRAVERAWALRHAETSPLDLDDTTNHETEDV